MHYTIRRTPEYNKWFKNQSPKSKVQIEKRLEKIEEEGHFGHNKNIGDGLFELKFKPNLPPKS